MENIIVVPLFLLFAFILGKLSVYTGPKPNETAHKVARFIDALDNAGEDWYVILGNHNFFEEETSAVDSVGESQ